MIKRLQPIAVDALRSVSGGTSTPLGSLQFFIATSSDPSRSVAKSFDVLTLSSPVVGVVRVTQDEGNAIPRIQGTPVPRRRGRWTATKTEPSPTVIVDGFDLVTAEPPRRRRRP